MIKGGLGFGNSGLAMPGEIANRQFRFGVKDVDFDHQCLTVRDGKA